MVEGHPVECGKIETELFHLFVPAGNCGDEYRGNKFREKYWGETMGKTILTAKSYHQTFSGHEGLDDVDLICRKGKYISWWVRTAQARVRLQNVFSAHINRKKGRSGLGRPGG